MQKNFLNVLLSFALVMLIAVTALTGCSGNNTQAGNDSPAAEQVKIDIGEGEREFIFEVIDNKDETTIWNVRTNQTMVGAALFEVGLIDSDSYITTVNGLTAEWEPDEEWWKFLIDGEMAITGIGETNIEEGKTYAFVFTKGF